MEEIVDYKTKYVYACLASQKFKVGDIAKGSGIKYNTVSYINKDPKRVLRSNVNFVNKMYLYFKSFNIPVDKLKDVKRVEKIEYYV